MTPPDRAAPTSLPTVSVPNDTRTFDRIWVQGIVVRVEREKAPSSSSGQGAPSPKSIALDDGTGVITVDVRGYVKMLRRSFPKLEARALARAPARFFMQSSRRCGVTVTYRFDTSKKVCVCVCAFFNWFRVCVQSNCF